MAESTFRTLRDAVISDSEYKRVTARVVLCKRVG